jgi:hypothetical protein
MTNWYFGWASILCGFASGATIGVHFHREDFLGGYASFRRRILRLGHIALVGLGVLNVLYSLSAAGSEPSLRSTVAAASWVVGGMTMPAVCFLSAWRPGLRGLFFIPVVTLALAAALTLRMGPP